MSIWIDLLFMHGHFATPRVLEHLLTPAAEPVDPPGGGSESLPPEPEMDDEEARNLLMEVKGIGSWSADIYLLMALGRSDIWPATDLALATAARKLKQLESRPDPNQLIEMAEAWRPFRSVAARMLWQFYLAKM